MEITRYCFFVTLPEDDHRSDSSYLDRMAQIEKKASQLDFSVYCECHSGIATVLAKTVDKKACFQFKLWLDSEYFFYAET